MAEPYVPKQYSKDGGLQEAVDFRSLAKSYDKSSIPDRDPTHASGGKRKRGPELEPEVSRKTERAALCALPAAWQPPSASR
jgi:hypothetical protein